MSDLSEGAFALHRSLLFTVAYEMLGSAADAEDVVQETWLRWADVDRAGVRAPRAYLVRIVTRQALTPSDTATCKDFSTSSPLTLSPSPTEAAWPPLLVVRCRVRNAWPACWSVSAQWTSRYEPYGSTGHPPPGSTSAANSPRQ